jgi:general secretion pathway protein A
MYQTYWGLRESPFRGLWDTSFFYFSPTHEEALARLQFLVQQGRRLGLLVGPSGSGKSFLLEMFASQLRRGGLPVAKISLLNMQPDEMLWQIVSQWGVNLDPTPSQAMLWRTLNDRLTEYRFQRQNAVVLVDDVDEADAAAIRQMTRLVGGNPSPEARLSVVLAGRKDTLSKLGDRLLELAELRMDLEPWEAADTERCVTTLLEQAGRRSPVFAKTAVARLHELSHGIPRRVSQLADLALLAGAGQELQQIDADVVDGVFEELCLSGR